MPTELVIPAFVAGLLTFLAPCTLPLVPGYLGFVAGAGKNKRLTVFENAVWYVMGFSSVFMLLGAAAGWGGSLVVQYREVVARAGGVMVIFFGLVMLDVIRWQWLEKDYHVWVRPGAKVSSLVLGMAFAVGWSPCVGPVLGTVLLLAAARSTLVEGMLLLGVFSLGLAIPFLLVALVFDRAQGVIKKINPYLGVIAKIGGVLLVLMGVLMVSGNFAVWVRGFYKLFGFMKYERILEYL